MPGVTDAAAVTTRVIAAGRLAWPEVTVADDVVAARIATRLAEDPESIGYPEHDADVYLAIALAEGDPAALRVFEDKLVPYIDSALRRLRLQAGAKDDVKQQVRVDLLVGDGRPKIGDYAGRGELQGWLRVTATRKALTFLRRGNREESLDELLLEHWPDAHADQRTQHLRT